MTTGDECIALAMLHGAEFYCDKDLGLWYIGRDTTHPIETARYGRGETYGFETRADIARAYCEHHNLLR